VITDVTASFRGVFAAELSGSVSAVLEQYRGKDHRTVKKRVWLAKGYCYGSFHSADSGEGNNVFRSDADNLSSSAKPAVLW
jgi:hypothetical protein